MEPQITWRARVDAAFATLARAMYRHRVKALLGIVLVVGALLAQLPKLTADNSTESFFGAKDPNLLRYNAFREQFGRDEMVYVLVSGETVFDARFLTRLRALHEALESEVPHVKKVTSLVNARDTRGEADTLVVEDLLEELPASAPAMAAWRERVLGSHLYPNLYVSEDGTIAALVVETVAFSQAGVKSGDLLAAFDEKAGQGRFEPITEAENAELVAAVHRVAERFQAPDFHVQLTGQPVIAVYFNEAVGRDVGVFMSLAFVAFSVFLLLLFRRLSGALLPLVVVVLSLGSTVGLLALTGTPFSSVTSILPSFLMAVGVGTSVHVLAQFYRRYAESGDKEQAVMESYRHTGLPVVMTGFTTAAGLFAFASSDMVPVANLGLFGGVGVIIILVFTMVALPALIAVLPVRSRARLGGARFDSWQDRVLTAVGHFATTYPRSIVVGAALIGAVSISGLAYQGFGHHFTIWLSKNSAERKALELVDSKLNGASTMEFVINTHQENGLYDPVVLERMAALERSLHEGRDDSGAPVVGKTTSVLDVLRETHQALNENRPEFYRLPTERALVAQELLLFENSGSDDLQRLVDSQFSKARLTAKVHDKDVAAYNGFIRRQEARAQELFAGMADVTVTGSLKLWSETVTLLMRSMAESYLAAGLVITVLMMLMLGSFRIGLLSMLPNLAPVAVTLGVMGWLGIRLDMSNMLLGTVAIGLAVDDTIHFFHNFRRYYAESGQTAEAVRRTLLSSGRAMVFTTLVLSTGFGLFAFASLVNLIQFGVLIALTLIVALLGDLVLAPAMLELILRTAYGRAVVHRWGGMSAPAAEPAPAAAEPVPAVRERLATESAAD